MSDLKKKIKNQFGFKTIQISEEILYIKEKSWQSRACFPLIIKRGDLSPVLGEEGTELTQKMEVSTAFSPDQPWEGFAWLTMETSLKHWALRKSLVSVVHRENTEEQNQLKGMLRWQPPV